MKSSAIIGNAERAKALDKFWAERGPDNDELLYVTAALMAGKQELSPVTALSISNSLAATNAAEFPALLQLAKCMVALEAVGHAMTDDKQSATFQGEIADAIISTGERMSKFGSLLRRKNVSSEKFYT
jgi:hypothetical protein